MKIQQFAEQLEQKSHPSPLLETLQALRRYDLSTLRDLLREDQGLGWIEWPSVQESRAEAGT